MAPTISYWWCVILVLSYNKEDPYYPSIGHGFDMNGFAIATKNMFRFGKQSLAYWRHFGLIVGKPGLYLTRLLFFCWVPWLPTSGAVTLWWLVWIMSWMTPKMKHNCWNNWRTHSFFVIALVLLCYIPVMISLDGALHDHNHHPYGKLYFFIYYGASLQYIGQAYRSCITM